MYEWMQPKPFPYGTRYGNDTTVPTAEETMLDLLYDTIKRMNRKEYVIFVSPKMFAEMSKDKRLWNAEIVRTEMVDEHTAYIVPTEVIEKTWEPTYEVE